MKENALKGSPRRAWAELRFSIIGHLLAAPPKRGQLGAELDRLAQMTWRHPRSGAPIRFGRSTIERWYYNARSAKTDPVSRLARRVRKDKGQRTAIGEHLEQALIAQYREHTGWSYKLHADNLAALTELDGELGPAPSYTSVRRFMKARGLVRQRRRPGGKRPGAERALSIHERREVRSYEAAYVGALWHLDYHHGSRKALGSDGRWHKVYLFGVLDDRSRLCCHLQWYLAETAENLVHGLAQAFLKRGLPRALMTDNGAAMLAQEVRQGLLRLGIVHETTLPYTPEQNAKQEILWAQVEGRLMAMLESCAELSLGELNEVTTAWIELDYNRKLHREIGTRPIDRFASGPEVLRPSPTGDALREAFMAETSRRIRRSDATVTVMGVRFEVPWRYRHLERLTLRYRSWDRSQVLLADQASGAVVARLRPLDKTKNASGARRTVDVGDAGRPGQSKSAPARQSKDQGQKPPLLRKMLAEYAATGLVPAYLPKDETSEEDPQR